MARRTFSRACSSVALGLAGAGAWGATSTGFDGSTNRLEAILAHNNRFVASKEYEKFTVASPPPSSRCVILTCMDSRLTHLLPAALNIKQGEAKIVKTAGAILSHPFGGIMRSIVVALYELKASEVFVIGHDDCGMRSVNSAATIEKMVAAGVPQDRLRVLESAGVDVKGWLKGFDSVDQSVLAAVEAVRIHPLMPPGVRVVGLIIDPHTGALRVPREAEGGGKGGGVAGTKWEKRGESEGEEH